jgi:hypothetical protein
MQPTPQFCFAVRFVSEDAARGAALAIADHLGQQKGLGVVEGWGLDIKVSPAGTTASLWGSVRTHLSGDLYPVACEIGALGQARHGFIEGTSAETLAAS